MLRLPSMIKFNHEDSSLSHEAGRPVALCSVSFRPVIRCKDSISKQYSQSIRKLWQSAAVLNHSVNRSENLF